MPSAIWTGAISFGLVQVPVKLVGATKSKDVSFNQLEEGTGARIRYRKVSDETGEEVTADRIERGFEVSKGRYVIVEPDEIDTLRPEGQSRDRDRGVRRPRRHRPALLRAAVLPRSRQARREAVRAAGRRDAVAQQGRDRARRDAQQGAARRDPSDRRRAVRRDDALRRRGACPVHDLVPDDRRRAQREGTHDGAPTRRVARGRGASSPRSTTTSTASSCSTSSSARSRARRSSPSRRPSRRRRCSTSWPRWRRRSRSRRPRRIATRASRPRPAEEARRDGAGQEGGREEGAGQGHRQEAQRVTTTPDASGAGRAGAPAPRCAPRRPGARARGRASRRRRTRVSRRPGCPPGGMRHTPRMRR